MSKWMRFFLYCGVACFSWKMVSIFCKKQTEGFTIIHTQSALPYNPEWETLPLSGQSKANVLTILSQPFYYLSRGGQCFVFISADKRYVIKLFKHRFFKPCQLLLSLPLPSRLEQFRQQKIEVLIQKAYKDYSSYKIAYEQIPEKTGMIYLQINPDKTLPGTLHLFDKLGIEHSLLLNETAFILQNYAEPISSYLERLKTEGNISQSEEAIHLIINTLVSCAHLGIVDTDPGFHRNLGFQEGIPMFMDVGRFKKNTPPLCKEEMKGSLGRFQTFLLENYPELLTHLREELNAL